MIGHGWVGQTMVGLVKKFIRVSYNSVQNLNKLFGQPNNLSGYKSFLLEDNCFTVLWWFSHNCAYIPSLLSLPPPSHPTALGSHRAPGWGPCVT